MQKLKADSGMMLNDILVENQHLETKVAQLAERLERGGAVHSKFIYKGVYGVHE